MASSAITEELIEVNIKIINVTTALFLKAKLLIRNAPTPTRMENMYPKRNNFNSLVFDIILPPHLLI
jgi:hypothetical protein